MKEWWKINHVNDHLRALESHLDLEKTRKEVDFIEKHFGNKNQAVLDLACGNGRHASVLAGRGHQVFGLDYSHEVLIVANSQGHNCQFINGNMRTLPFKDQSFGMVLSMWQSIGYFDSELENLQVFSEVSRILSDGGIYVLQVNNPLYVINNLAQRGAVFKDGKQVLDEIGEGDEGKVLKTTTFDPSTFRYVSSRRSSHENINQAIVHDMRYFSVPELTHHLAENGIEVLAIFGSVTEERYSAASKEIVIVASK